MLGIITKHGRVHRAVRLFLFIVQYDLCTIIYQKKLINQITID